MEWQPSRYEKAGDAIIAFGQRHGFLVGLLKLVLFPVLFVDAWIIGITAFLVVTGTTSLSDVPDVLPSLLPWNWFDGDGFGGALYPEDM